MFTHEQKLFYPGLAVRCVAIEFLVVMRRIFGVGGFFQRFSRLTLGHFAINPPCFVDFVSSGFRRLSIFGCLYPLCLWLVSLQLPSLACKTALAYFFWHHLHRLGFAWPSGHLYGCSNREISFLGASTCQEASHA